jgi:hypothetical protein
MIRLTTENTQKAVERCKQLKPREIRIKDRQFAVYSSNNSNVYHVSFDVKTAKSSANANAKRRKKEWFVITSRRARRRTFTGNL